MKTLFREIFEVLGAEVREFHPHELQVIIPKQSPADGLLAANTKHLLSFSSENKNPGAVVVSPGSALLETTALKLSHIGAARHGVLPARYPGSKKTLRNKYQGFGETNTRFSCRRGWKVLVRIWLKIQLTGDEVVEILEGFEIPANQQPHKLEGLPSADQDVRWVQKPPLKLYQLKQIIEAGFGFAENSIIEKAGKLQKKNLKALFPVLERLKAYYRQLANDTVGIDGEQTGAIEAEYRRRLQEEIQDACVKATAELIALETISTPVQNLKWQLQQNGRTKEVNAVFNLYDGSLESTAGCAICGGRSCFFSILDSVTRVCENCYALCDICGAEIVDRQTPGNRICAICKRVVCSKHALYCGTCGKLVCSDHQAQCIQGCRICPDCIRHCQECGETIIWCKDHAPVNSSGDLSCRIHSVFCVGCRENYPMGKTVACAICEQTICLNCHDHCRSCGRKFCLKHVEEGRCHTCQTSNPQMSLF
ncbi:hypothetical protein JY97_15805 [Alkalispirochaeta odontotermitis]|nr:hypothetical protein JY97_15805 [Alkalispirochaeta odontotermitis]CAB1074375.1 hypothetical protein D1AOALGA4SA_2194 [Olavius algarvensis Delta 1 endosymbiont]